jgi:hypothetical protein
MIAMASRKEVSIKSGVWLIGNDLAMPEMDGDCPKYILWYFGNTSM